MSRTLWTAAPMLAVYIAVATLVPPDVTRAVNVTLALLAAIGLAVRTNDIWQMLTPGRKVSYVGVVVVLVGNAYGWGEAYLQQTQTGARGPILFTAYVLVLVGLWRSRHDEHPSS